MKYLKKTWVRVLVSLFAGGMIAEIIWIMTADNLNAQRPPSTTAIVLVSATIFYYLLDKKFNK